MKIFSDGTRLVGPHGRPSTAMVGSRGARTPIGILSAVTALAGCGGDGGSSAQDGRTFGDSDHPLADLTVDAGTEIVPIDLSAAYFEVGDGGARRFAATLENGGDLSAAGLRLDGGSRIVGSIDDARTVAILVTVDDANGETFMRRFTITAENPAASGGRPRVDISQLAGDRRAVTGEAISAIDVTRGFRDPDGDGDDLTYAVEFSRTGHGLTFHETTNEITGEFSGTEDVTAIVTVTNGDDGGAVEHRIIISANRMPTAGEAPLPENLSAVAGQLIAPMDMASAFMDPEGTPMTFVVEMADGSELADAGLMTRDGMIMGAPESAGVMRIRVTATDADGASSSREITITVAEADSPTPGDDLLVNGYRNEVIDGGAGNDTVIYTDVRSNYRIWRETPTDGGGVRTIVLDKTNAPGNDEGRDALTDIEVLRFGGRSGSDTPLSSLTFDTPVTSVAPNAPTESTFTLEEEFAPIDAGGWFEGGDARTYSIEVTGGTVEGLSIDPASGLITAAPDAEGTFVITVTASDDPDAAATYDDSAHSHTLTVVEAQRPVPSPMSRVEDDHVLGSPISAIDLQRWFVDRQGDAITFEVEGVDGTGLSVDDNGVINGTPLKSGSLEITITATDTGGFTSAEHTYTLNVTTRPENALFALQDRTVVTGRPITPIAVDGAFHDPDGDELTFSFEVGSQLGMLESIGLGYDDSTGLITGTFDDAGSHMITVEASDGNGGTHERTFTVTAVGPIPGQEDRDPEILIQRLPDTGDANETRVFPDGAVVFTKGREISPIDIRPLFNDPDNDRLNYQAFVGRLGEVDSPRDERDWENLDASWVGLSVNDGVISGRFSDTYGPGPNGWRTEESFEIVMRARDGGPGVKYGHYGLATDPQRAGSDSVYTWGLLPSFVVHVNSAPEASATSPLMDMPVWAGSEIRAIDVSSGFVDPDPGATLEFSVTGLEGTGLYFHDNMISGNFRGFQGMDTRKTVTVTATDEHDIGTTDEIVLYSNSPPTLVPDATGPLTNAEFDTRIGTINFADYFQDEDVEHGDSLTYQAALLDADGMRNGRLSDVGLRFDPALGILSGRLSRDPESVGVEVVASDESGESASMRIEFTVNARPDFDESVGFPEITLTIGEPIQTPIDLTGAFSDDEFIENYLAFIGRMDVEEGPGLRVLRFPESRGLMVMDGMLSGTLEADPDDGSGIVHDDDLEIYIHAHDRFGAIAIDERLSDLNLPMGGERLVLPAFVITANVKPKASGTPLESVELEFDGMEITPIDASVAFADDDGDELTFSATGLGPLDIDRDTGVISGTPSSPGLLDVTVTAGDGHWTISQDFTINVYETLRGDDDANELTGGAGASIIEGLGGGDTLRGGGGDDIVHGHSASGNGPGADMDRVVYSGVWSDYFIDGRLDDLGGTLVPWITLRDKNPDDGDDGFDTLVGIEELEFSDISFTVSATATAGNDILFGTAGIDGVSLEGEGGFDIIFGFGSGDGFGGGTGSDTLIGGGGDDVLDAGFSHRDMIFGGPGDDIIRGHGGGVTALYPGDIHDYRFESGGDGTGVRVVDHRNGGRDGIHEGSDTLYGMDWIEFGDGTRISTDNIHFSNGSGATRSFAGGEDRDIFHVRGAYFELTGNGGADIFQILSISDSSPFANTLIRDFDPAEGDRILIQRDALMGRFLEVDVIDEGGFTLLTTPSSELYLRVGGAHPDLLDHVLFIGEPARSDPGPGAAVRLDHGEGIVAVGIDDDARFGPVAEYVVMPDQRLRSAAEENGAGNDGGISEFSVAARDEPAEPGSAAPLAAAERELIHALSWIEPTPEYDKGAFEAGADYVFYS